MSEDLLDFKTTKRFRKDRKLMKRQGRDLSSLDDIILKLRKLEPLAIKHRDHALAGNFVGCRECHVEPDWLLIYGIDKKKLVLIAFRTGTHSELLKL